MLRHAALAFLGVSIAVLWRKLHPKPYPGIPHNAASAKRIGGDVPELIPIFQTSEEVTDAMFAITTQKLGTPIAQVLFPSFRQPLIVLEDPHEIEDIIVRRHKEFDKAATNVDFFVPMFPRGTLSQYTTPQLKMQKRLWADTMQPDFLRRAAGPRIHKATLELVELWRLKASAAYKDQPFDIHDDFKNATLDAIWATLVGEETGLTRFNIEKLKAQMSNKPVHDQAPAGAFVKEGMEYITQAFARNSKSVMPVWAQKLETYTPRHRRFRNKVISGVSQAMRKSVDRFKNLETLEADSFDTCMMDLVLRRQILQAEKAGTTPTDPTKDANLLDEMFVILVGGHDSTANALSWFMKFMEAYPSVQKELRAVLKANFPITPSVNQILDADIPYLSGACEEIFRLAGTAKGVMREATVDTEILGYKIPKGAEVLFNVHINRPPLPVDESKRSPSVQAGKHGDCFSGAAGRDISSFQPTRWLFKDEETCQEKFDAYALPSLAFGGGYRGCFGRKLAAMELRIIVVLVILNLEVLPLPEELRSMEASEQLFRRPKMPFAKLRAL